MAASRQALRTLGLVLFLALGCSNADSPAATDAANPETPVTSSPPPPPAEVTLKTVKYDELAEAIKAHKGKVVVVDVWATYCGPCKVEFPNFVALHTRRADDGVVCVSVCVDKKDDFDLALKYLKTQKADTTNFLLDEDSDVWAKKWKVKAVPVAFVFNRKGELVRKFDNDNVGPKDKGFSYEDINKVVDDLLKPGF